MERSPRSGKKKSPRQSRPQTPDRRHSSTSDVLRRMALTSSAHKLEREQTRPTITPRSMITDYISSQVTAEPVLRQKRRAHSMEPESSKKRPKISVSEEETPRTQVDRLLSQMQTQTPVVRQTRRRSSEKGNYDDTVEKIMSQVPKRRSESFIEDDADDEDENIVPPSQEPRLLNRSKAIKSSFVADQVQQMDRIAGGMRGSQNVSQPGYYRHGAGRIGEIMYDSSPSESTPAERGRDSSHGDSYDERSEESEKANSTREQSLVKRKVSTGKNKKISRNEEDFIEDERDHVDEDVDDELGANRNSHEDDQSEDSYGPQDPTSVSGIDMIPSSDVEENSGTHKDFQRSFDGFSPVIPNQTPGPVIHKRRSSSGIVAPQPRAPVVATTPVSERRVQMSNSFQPTNVARRVSRESASASAKFIEEKDYVENRKRSVSVTPTARVRGDTPASARSRRDTSMVRSERGTPGSGRGDFAQTPEAKDFEPESSRRDADVSIRAGNLSRRSGGSSKSLRIESPSARLVTPSSARSNRDNDSVRSGRSNDGSFKAPTPRVQDRAAGASRRSSIGIDMSFSDDGSSHRPASPSPRAYLNHSSTTPNSASRTAQGPILTSYFSENKENRPSTSRVVESPRARNTSRAEQSRRSVSSPRALPTPRSSRTQEGLRAETSAVPKAKLSSKTLISGGKVQPNLYDFFGEMEKKTSQKAPTPQKKAPGKLMPKRTAPAPKRKTTPAKPKTKPKKKEIGITTAQMKEMFKLYCRLPVAKTAFAEIESLCEQFFDNVGLDLEAYAAHAGRQYITCDDMLLLMKRQKFITDKVSLDTLVEKNLPIEMREKIIPSAISGNKLTGTALMKKKRNGNGRKKSIAVESAVSESESESFDED